MRLDEQARRELRVLTLTVVADCLARLRELRDQGFEFEAHNYPVRVAPDDEVYSAVKWTSTGDVPRRFKGAFGIEDGYKTAVLCSDVPGIQALLEFVKQHSTLKEWLVPSRISDDDFAERLLTFAVSDLPLEIVDRHIHIAGWDLDDEVVSEIYGELETWWLSTELPVELWIPILGIDFEADSLKFFDGVSVRRLSADEQLARWPGHRLDGQESLVAMATHALIIPGWAMPNRDSLGWLAANWGPPEHVQQAEHFFQSLAMVTDQPSGYIQVVASPVGWAPGYVANLPAMLIGALVANKRSMRFRHESEPLTTLDNDKIKRLTTAYSARSNSKELALAAARLLSAERRSDDADRIVDLCVGLEALLSDSQGETTYKIAIRAAAMLAKAGMTKPSGFIGPMKKIYAHRSSVVHGRAGTTTAAVEIDGRTIPTETLARDVLRQLLQVRMADQSLTPNEIDNRLLGGALDQFAKIVAGNDDEA